LKPISQGSDLLQVVLNLDLLCLYFVEVGLSCSLVLAHGRPKPIVQVVLECVDAIGLLQFKCHAVALYDLDQLRARLLLEQLPLLKFVNLLVEGAEHLHDLGDGLLNRQEFVTGA